MTNDFWGKGEVDLEVLDDSMEQDVLRERYQLKNEMEFHNLLAQFALKFGELLSKSFNEIFEIYFRTRN